MKKRSASIGIVGLLVISGLIGLANFGSDDAQGTPVSGSITKDTTWDLAGSPYIVVGNITVASGFTLTIEPGVEVKFDGFYYIDVEGTLIAVGEETDRIIITSNRATPMPGDWNCIGIAYYGHGEIEYCDISYGLMALCLGAGNNITNNNIYLNDLCGIVACGSPNNTIANNNISYNNQHGIFFNGSSNNIIENNDFFSNNYHGICLSASEFNTIVGNNFSNNQNGIFINAINNDIYHNNFIDNTNRQARDTTNNGNQWDNGYPSGGNYWSDFDEPSEGAYDDYKGPNQDVLGSDGKVDLGPPAGGKNPYIIDSDSQDNYPLIKPFGSKVNDPNENSILLYEGWNLISIPFIQSDTSLSTVLNSIEDSYDSVQWCNVSDRSDPWKIHHTSKPINMNDLDCIDHTMGFWIHITEPGGILFQYPGTKPAEEQNINLYPGWNLIGYPSTIERTPPFDLPSCVEVVQGYNASSGLWENWDSGGLYDPDTLLRMKPGQGFWVYSTANTVWTLGDSSSPTLDFMLLTDCPDGTQLTTITMPVGGTISAYASGYNCTGPTYLELVECDWTDNGGTWSPNPGGGSTFTAGAIPGSYLQTATSTSDPSIFDTVMIEIV